MSVLRFGLPAVLALIGVLFLCFGSETLRYETFAMCVGAALSLLLFTFLYSMGVSGDRERDEEEAARRYLAEHGHWPDEEPPPGA